MRNINKIIVHCTATPPGRNVTIADIDRWHRNRGFDCIGYHYVVYLDGSVHQGRPMERAGAHCRGYNATSIGVCYVGGVADDCRTPLDTRTEAQKASLLSLLKELKGRFPLAEIHSHSDYARKGCPSFDATGEYADL
ncbi:MAG: N-acetylmuramoyl-L-alanine amidase [Muribaculaceae bacterium]|nr:N-acetylmuramoyl-L-alanine amidase [Muribaculaceae bacterium]